MNTTDHPPTRRPLIYHKNSESDKITQRTQRITPKLILSRNRAFQTLCGHDRFSPLLKVDRRAFSLFRSSVGTDATHMCEGAQQDRSHGSAVAFCILRFAFLHDAILVVYDTKTVVSFVYNKSEIQSFNGTYVKYNE
jgi:hypothetical protein